MAKKKKTTIKLNKGLVLNRYILSLFGCTKFEQMAIHLKPSKLEGYDEENISNFYTAIKLYLIGSNELNKDILLEYDQNIYRHTLEISEHREDIIKWKYFQYLTLLFTEIYLDKYFSDSKSLLQSLNEFVDQFNDSENADVPNEHNFEAQKFTLKNLNKIAIWSATGSGKTLLLHVNIKQYLYYAKKYNKTDFNKIVLITPNEGLSSQHLKEFKDSNMDAEIFSRSSGGMFAGNIIEIIEISKLSEDSGDKTVAVDSFETNNLVLIDEGHRGASGEEWKQRRDALSENGFAFEYSATFGQAISAASGTKKETLLNEYSKAILFDYSYKFFYNDGYGKDYKILNIKDDSNEIYLRKYLTACLLGYYQQQLVFDENISTMTTYLLEKPLWIFVGGSVTKALNKKEASDVVTIVKFISDFIKDSRTSVDHIEQIINGNAGLTSDEGAAIFSNSFKYIINKGQSGKDIYQDILTKVFNTNLTGANVHIDNLKGIDGELGLRIGDTTDYFGVINVGDDSKLHKLCIEAGILGMDKDFSSSLFKQINEKGSKINLLIGSRKFTEGWSSWRVSTMGLMNIGRGEGSQIIQLFGRGVRLKGYEMSLKRSSKLDDFQKPDTPTPKYVPTLETLNIFGIKADYMQQFKEYLEDEGLPTNDGNFVNITIPVTKRYDKKEDPLKIIQTKAGVAENYKKENIISLEITPLSQHLNIILDWYPKIAMLSSRKSSSSAVEQQKHICTFEQKHLAFVDWDAVYFEIQRYKNERSWYNLAVTKENLQAIMQNNTWYEIHIPEADMKASSYNKVFDWQEMVISLLKMYTEKYYLSVKNEFLSRHIEVAILQEDHPNFIDEYDIRVEENESDIITHLKAFKDEVESEDHLDDDIIINPNGFRGFDNAKHLYYPLIYMNEKNFKEIVKIYPYQLNEGEREFLNDLKTFYTAEQEYFENKKVYVLRNQSKTGIGFLTETKNFYPDFILWQIIGEKQYVSFIDPKGLYHMKNIWNHPKIKLHETIKSDFQSQLNDLNTFLNSFIISNTSFNTIKANNETIDMYHDANVYFQEEDKNTYIKNVLNKGLTE